MGITLQLLMGRFGLENIIPLDTWIDSQNYNNCFIVVLNDVYIRIVVFPFAKAILSAKSEN